MLKHGLSNEPLYKRWQSMKARCLKKNSKDYRYYGARGITICREWESDFHAFYKWALSSGYSPELTVDRIDNSLGYSPQNCRWTTTAVQNANRRLHGDPPVFGPKPLSPKLKEIISLFSEHSTLCAEQVKSLLRSEMGITAYNNRMETLRKLGFLVRRRVGKTNHYSINNHRTNP